MLQTFPAVNTIIVSFPLSILFLEFPVDIKGPFQKDYQIHTQLCKTLNESMTFREIKLNYVSINMARVKNIMKLILLRAIVWNAPLFPIQILVDVSGGDAKPNMIMSGIETPNPFFYNRLHALSKIRQLSTQKNQNLCYCRIKFPIFQKLSLFFLFFMYKMQCKS